VPIKSPYITIVTDPATGVTTMTINATEVLIKYGGEDVNLNQCPSLVEFCTGINDNFTPSPNDPVTDCQVRVVKGELLIAKCLLTFDLRFLSMPQGFRITSTIIADIYKLNTSKMLQAGLLYVHHPPHYMRCRPHRKPNNACHTTRAQPV
jgi:hypothetical protein